MDNVTLKNNLIEFLKKEKNGFMIQFLPIELYRIYKKYLIQKNQNNQNNQPELILDYEEFFYNISQFMKIFYVRDGNIYLGFKDDVVLNDDITVSELEADSLFESDSIDLLTNQILEEDDCGCNEDIIEENINLINEIL